MTSFSLPTSISTFVVQVIQEAILIVDENRFLFANKGFENLCGLSFCSFAQDPKILMREDELSTLFGNIQIFFSDKHTAENSLNNCIIECFHSQSGAFLSKVSFHPFVDITDNNKKKCICLFSDPLFYPSLFDNDKLIGIISYSERKGILRRANSHTAK